MSETAVYLESHGGLEKVITEHASLSAELARLRAALTPSAETKARYMGEFTHEIRNPADPEGTVTHQIPWTTIKQIMRAIAAEAEAG